jgi:hypothetical protein
LTMKLAPGSAWNTGMSVASLLMYKMIIGTDLNEGVSDKAGDASKALRRPESR